MISDFLAPVENEILKFKKDPSSSIGWKENFMLWC